MHNSRQNKIIISIDYETWQPIPKGKVVDWETDILCPAKKLMDLCDDIGIKICFMVEMCELFWLEKNDFEMYQKVELQIQEIVTRGHDVQLHMHPNWMPEYGAKCVDGEYVWDWNIASCNDVPDDLNELVRKCKNKLENMARKAKPDYKCVAFRAGSYRIQPFGRIYEALISNDIKIDSSVYYNGISCERGYDFRRCVSTNNPYKASHRDPQLKARNEKFIYEFPLAVNRYSKRLFIDNQAVDSLAKNWISMGGGAFDDKCNYFVLIGHTKAYRDIDELGRQLVMIKNWPNTEFTTFSDEYKKIFSYFELTESKANKSIDEVKEIMNYIYSSVSPGQICNAKWVGDYFYEQKALCFGYAWMLGCVLRTYGYNVKWLTVYADDMPKGRGENHRDTHELLSLKLNGNKFILCPTSNMIFPYGIKTLLRNPELADEIVEKNEKDKRFYERNYSTYTTSFFFRRVKFFVHRGFPMIAVEKGRRSFVVTKIYNFIHCKIPSMFVVMNR